MILSEPLTIIPYTLEMHKLRPDYNLPASDLFIQSERVFVNQFALWLLKVKVAQPLRKYIFYVGATHHYFILHFANIVAGSPFELIYEISPRGLATYIVTAKKMEKEII
ncbi:MAG: hypothetical protein GF311_10075 [Candidatus Lokiarchaeota archaeon]|nr:hypothetical protein [Candidatus Lokiarchaeota archaeon]